MKRHLLASFTILGLFVLPAAGAATQMRVATWNLESVGTPGSIPYNAALATIERIAPDVLVLQGVNTVPDSVNGAALAADAGLFVVDVPVDVSIYGKMVLFSAPAGEVQVWDASSISGDPMANDISEPIVRIGYIIHDNVRDCVIITTPMKEGMTDEDEFVRAVESHRLSFVRDDIKNGTCGTCSPIQPAFVVIGGMNEEIDTVPQTPDPFTSVPPGLMPPYMLGSDLAGLLPFPGITNDPFAKILDGSTFAVDALQLDGSDATQASSGRRLDYIFTGPLILSADGETYDSADEGLPGGLTKTGPPLPPNTSGDASDNFMVFSDILVPHSLVIVPLSPPNDSFVREGEELVIKAEVSDPGCDDKCLDFELQWTDSSDPGFITPTTQSSLTDPGKFHGFFSGDVAPLGPLEPVTTPLPPLPPGTYIRRLRVIDTTAPVYAGPWSEPQSFTVDPAGPAPPFVDWFQTTEAQFQSDYLENAITDGDGVIIMNEVQPGTLVTQVISLSELTMYSSSTYTMWNQLVVNGSHPDIFTMVEVEVEDTLGVPLLPPVVNGGTPGPFDIMVDLAPIAAQFIQIKITLRPGSTPRINSILVTGNPATALDVPDVAPPVQLRLHPASPNPFRSSTAIAFEVPQGAGPVSLRVFDLQGRLVRTLLSDASVTGPQSAAWDGRDDRGTPLPIGIYLYQLVGERLAASGKAVLIR